MITWGMEPIPGSPGNKAGDTLDKEPTYHKPKCTNTLTHPVIQAIWNIISISL